MEYLTFQSLTFNITSLAGLADVLSAIMMTMPNMLAMMIILMCTILLLINGNVKSVLALATPSSRRRSQKSARLHQNNKSSTSGGFARQKQKIVASGPTTTDTNTAPNHDRRIDDISEVTKTIVTNLFSVCYTLQNPKYINLNGQIRASYISLAKAQQE